MIFRCEVVFGYTSQQYGQNNGSQQSEYPSDDKTIIDNMYLTVYLKKCNTLFKKSNKFFTHQNKISKHTNNEEKSLSMF